MKEVTFYGTILGSIINNGCINTGGSYGALLELAPKSIFWICSLTKIQRWVLRSCVERLSDQDPVHSAPLLRDRKRLNQGVGRTAWWTVLCLFCTNYFQFTIYNLQYSLQQWYGGQRRHNAVVILHKQYTIKILLRSSGDVFSISAT